jgi:2-oxoglutarate ferredoxin oxidoreductase subunit alpha
MFQEVESVVIRFAGDSGDGMQTVGLRFGQDSALAGNDVSTFPDYPAEIRAPAGTLAGVSGYQINFSERAVLTPGDAPDILVALNPAALKSNLSDLKLDGTLVVNADAFTSANLKKAGYASNPLEDDSLSDYQLHAIPLTTLNRTALADITELTTKDVDRCKNFFALGLTYWVFDRPLAGAMKFITDKFAKYPNIAEANRRALEAGYHFGDTTQTFQMRYRIKPAQLQPGLYRKVTGNEALVLGLVTAAQKANKPLVYASYPITPASDVLHYLAALKHFDVRTFQAEDEIAAMGAAIGAAFGGTFAVTGTSGPGLALKSEGLNLAMMLELPMVVVNVQRAGPSTGMPTKPEQADLLQAMFGRNGESPLPILAPSSPSDCFDIALDACRFAMRTMSPVILLSDGYLANSAEPWLIPNADTIPAIPITHPTEPNSEDGFLPYKRHPETLARPWALPGTPNLEHRMGGLGKQPETGAVSYLPEENQQMVNERAEKVARLVEVMPPQEVFGSDSGDLLVIGWGSTYGALYSAVAKARAKGLSVSHAHIRYLNPFPKNLGDIIANFDRVLVPEMNMGQLLLLLQHHYQQAQYISFPKVQGRPFTIGEVLEKIETILGGNS